MGAGSLNTETMSWRLQGKHAIQTQGIVASPFAHLPHSVAMLLTLAPGGGGQWLADLRRHLTISDARAKTESAAAIAFTWSGLQQIGLDQDALNSFAPAFKEGMHEESRRRRLGDTADSGTLFPGGPVWNGNGLDEHGVAGPAAVHVCLLLYEANDQLLAQRQRDVETLLSGRHITVARSIAQRLRFDSSGQNAREHFGFIDGISQPVPTGAGIVAPNAKGAEEQAKWHGVAAGDILMGHINAHNDPAPGPVIAESAGRGNFSSLPGEGVPAGFRNLGLNGSYLVVRELRQDVAGFWQAVEKKAAQAGMTAQTLAERMVGRTMNGCPLHLSAETPGAPASNNFGFTKADVFGLACPIGSHMRRANPRDSLPSRDGPSPDLSMADDLLQSTKNHRILRRARSFGPDIGDKYVDDKKERGLLFMCLNTDIERQFEFVQQNWMLNPNFGTLFKETDPLMGPPGMFTIPDERLRKRVEVESYIQFVGGEYFFLPSIPALDYFASI